MKNIIKPTILRNGFTLLELILTFVIISILALLVIPDYKNAKVKTKVAKVQSDFHQVAFSVQKYYLDWMQFPQFDLTNNLSIPEILYEDPYNLSTQIKIDPFAPDYAKEDEASIITNNKAYTYHRIMSVEEENKFFGYVPNELKEKYSDNKGIKWRVISKGPDEIFAYVKSPQELHELTVQYNPSNGIVSKGNIIRSCSDK